MFGCITLSYFVLGTPRPAAGWLFGGKVATEFNSVNSLELICRAHQLVQVRCHGSAATF